MTERKRYYCEMCFKKCQITADTLEFMDDRPSFCPYKLNGAIMEWKEVNDAS